VPSKFTLRSARFQLPTSAQEGWGGEQCLTFVWCGTVLQARLVGPFPAGKSLLEVTREATSNLNFSSFFPRHSHFLLDRNFGSLLPPSYCPSPGDSTLMREAQVRRGRGRGVLRN
jgi:hypothetical protein